jgi:hypothetical protein
MKLPRFIFITRKGHEGRLDEGEIRFSHEKLSLLCGRVCAVS